MAPSNGKSKVSGSLSKNQKKEVKALIDANEKAESELKQWAPATVAHTPNSTPSIYGLNSAIVQGDGKNNRQGSIIRPQYLEYNFNAGLTSTASNTFPYTFRFLIFRDMEADGVLPGGSDIFEHATDPLSVYNSVHMLNNPKRFQIIEDKIFMLQRDTSRAMTHMRDKIDLSKRSAVKYLDGGAGTDASLGTGAYIYLVMTNSGTSTGVFTNLDYRLAFYDD